MEQATLVDTRQRIIEAAIQVAAESGFTQATTKEIARQADCSEGIIYHYFSSKHELFLAVIKENTQEFLRQLKAEVDERGSAKDKLERVIDFHFRFFTGKVHIFQILFGKSGDAMVPFPYILQTVILPYSKFVEDIVIRGIQDGEFYRLPANLVASNLLGMMQFNILKLHFGAKDSPVGEIKATIKHLIFNPLLKSKASGAHEKAR